MTVDKERVRLWVEALRSGKYRQGRSGLRTVTGSRPDRRRDEFCCLGVACVVAQRNGCRVEWARLRRRRGRTPSRYMTANGRYGFLPDEVQEWFGLPTDNPELRHTEKSGGYSRSCIGYNDKLKASFDEIADAIEEMYL